MITILKGDAYSDRFGRSLEFTVKTHLDTTGIEVRFDLYGVSTTSSIVDRGAKIQLTSEQTKKMDFGMGYASLALVVDGEVYTLKNDIPVLVTDSMSYVENSSNSITVDLKGAWDKALQGVNWDAGSSIASLRDFLARVGTALGASVVAR
jgi:hypothetical protein